MKLLLLVLVLVYSLSSSYQETKLVLPRPENHPTDSRQSVGDDLKLTKPTLDKTDDKETETRIKRQKWRHPDFVNPEGQVFRQRELFIPEKCKPLEREAFKHCAKWYQKGTYEDLYDACCWSIFVEMCMGEWIGGECGEKLQTYYSKADARIECEFFYKQCEYWIEDGREIVRAEKQQLGIKDSNP